MTPRLVSHLFGHPAAEPLATANTDKRTTFPQHFIVYKTNGETQSLLTLGKGRCVAGSSARSPRSLSTSLISPLSVQNHTSSQWTDLKEAWLSSRYKNTKTSAPQVRNSLWD